MALRTWRFHSATIIASATSVAVTVAVVVAAAEVVRPRQPRR
jgi:hypothetical protein